MAFDPVEYLKQGNVDFIYNLTTYDEKNLIKRIRESSDKKEIIDGCIDKLKDTAHSFILEIIYDIDEYKEELFYILEKHNAYSSIDSDFRKVGNILYNTTFGVCK